MMIVESTQVSMTDQQGTSIAEQKSEFVDLFDAAFPYLTQTEKALLADLAAKWANNGIVKRDADYRRQHGG